MSYSSSSRTAQKKHTQFTKEQIERLSRVRIIQKNLVHFLGFPDNLYEKEKICSFEYFGQYGKIIKISLASTNDRTTHKKTNSAYVTFETSEQAAYCILSVDSIKINEHLVRAFFGTTKYCNHYLNNFKCFNEDKCSFLHYIADEENCINEKTKFGYSEHIKLAKKIIVFGSTKSKNYVSNCKVPAKPMLPTIKTIYFKEDIVAKSLNHRRQLSSSSGGSTKNSGSVGSKNSKDSKNSKSSEDNDGDNIEENENDEKSKAKTKTKKTMTKKAILSSSTTVNTDKSSSNNKNNKVDNKKEEKIINEKIEKGDKIEKNDKNEKKDKKDKKISDEKKKDNNNSSNNNIKIKSANNKQSNNNSNNIINNNHNNIKITKKIDIFKSKEQSRFSFANIESDNNNLINSNTSIENNKNKELNTNKENVSNNSSNNISNNNMSSELYTSDNMKLIIDKLSKRLSFFVSFEKYNNFQPLKDLEIGFCQKLNKNKNDEKITSIIENNFNE